MSDNVHEVMFESSGVGISATIYGRAADRAPAVLLCSGFSGTQDAPSIVAAARAFADAGWIAATFDYRGFGESEGVPRQVVSVPGQLDDIRAALSDLRARPQVDPDKVALWGSSLGGGHAVTIAAEDSRLAAVVAQVPFNGFPKQPPERMRRSKKAAWALFAAALRDRLRGWLRRPPLYVKAVGTESELAVMVGPDANRTIEVLTSGTWRNEVAPRGLLDMMAYKPGKVAHRIAAPLLIVSGELDGDELASLTEQLASDAPRGELRSYPFAHFDVYRPEIREQVLADQVDFLRRAFDR